MRSPCSPGGRIDDPTQARLRKKLADLKAEVRVIEEKLAGESDVRPERERRLLIFDVIERSSPDIITIVRPDGEILYVSRNVSDVLEYDARDFVERNVWDYVHPDHVKRVKNELKSLSPSLEGGPVEFQIRRAGGEWLWVETRIAAHRRGHSESTNMVCVSRDISQRVLLERHLNRQKVLHDAVTMVAPLAIVALDSAGGIVTCMGALWGDRGRETFRRVKTEVPRCAEGALHAIEGEDVDVTFDWAGDRYDAQFRAVGEVSSTISAVGVVTTVSRSVG